MKRDFSNQILFFIQLSREIFILPIISLKKSFSVPYQYVWFFCYFRLQLSRYQFWDFISFGNIVALNTDKIGFHRFLIQVRGTLKERLNFTAFIKHLYRLPKCPLLIIWSDIISELQYNTNTSVGSKSGRNTVFDLMLNIANQTDG